MRAKAKGRPISSAAMVRRVVMATLVMALLVVGLPRSAFALETPLEVGSKRFTESYLLGEIIADRVALHTAAIHHPGLGNTAVTLAALGAGAIDCYPEYLGTIELEILKKDSASGDLAQVNQELKALHLIAVAPLGFADRYALALSAETAARLGVSRISQLALHPELRFGLSQEFIGRHDGWFGLALRYGLPQQPTGIDHGLAYAALASHQIDVMDIYSTDARIASEHLVVLEDDLHYFPNYDAVILARDDVAAKKPTAWGILSSLGGSISPTQMIAMNRAVEIDGRDFHAVARAFVNDPHSLSGDASAGAKAAATKPQSFAAKLFGPDLPRLLFEHLRLVLISIGAAMLMGIPLGVAAAANPRIRPVILSTTGLLQTLPTLALLAFLIPLLGRIGTLPALIALFLYGLLPIVRNTAAGLDEVPAGLKQAALALGLSASQRLWLIDLPLAARVILAGIKTATILAIGTATLAALIGAGGFGERITIGLALNDNQMLLAGAIPAAALALLAEFGFSLIDRVLARPTLRGNA